MISPRPILSSQSSGFFSRSTSFSRPASFSAKPPTPPASPNPLAPTPLSCPFSCSASFSRPASFSCSASFSASAMASSVANAAPNCAAASLFYRILGLQAGATDRDMKVAYHQLARAIHPDGSPYRHLACAIHPDGSPYPASSDDFILVHTAYSTLFVPNKRADYDRHMIPCAIGRRRLASRAPDLRRSPMFPGSRRRT